MTLLTVAQFPVPCPCHSCPDFHRDKLQQGPSILLQKSLHFFCHSGLDPESSVSELDSRFRRDFKGAIYFTLGPVFRFSL